MVERTPRWTHVQNSIHGPVPSGYRPKVRGIREAVGEWQTQLCIYLPQVTHASLDVPGLGANNSPRFVVLVSDRDLARKVFKSHAYVKPCLVPIAETLLGKKAWVFIDGKEHIDYRKGLNGLFTRQALQSYLPTQEKVWSTYFQKFVADSATHGGKPMEHMTAFREINCALSCRTFVGNYISDHAVKKIADDYYCITAALELVNIPLSLYVPYTKVWLGYRAAQGVLAEFERCAAESKKNMATGQEPTCIADHWVLNMIESKAYHDKIAAGEKDPEKPAVLVRQFTDFEIAQTLFTFLFASQDASSSSTIWLFQKTAQRPDILDRIRQENLDARGGDKEKPLTLEMLESMTYTNAVVKEILRWRPPVIFVPYEAKKAFPVTDTYTVPKGALVVPSCWPALHDPEVYPRPDDFDPERWISGTANEQAKNWLVFGNGAHRCIAEQYVQLTMVAMIGKAALEVDWVHYPTARSEEIKVFATLFPMVSCSYLERWEISNLVQDKCPLVFTNRA